MHHMRRNETIHHGATRMIGLCVGRGQTCSFGMRSLSWTFFRIGFFLAVDERNAVAVQSLAWQCTCGLGWLGQFLLPFHPH